MRLALALSTLLLIGSPAPSAGVLVPDPTTSTIPRFVRVVGTWSGVPDPSGAYKVVIRDALSNPIANSVVTLDFGLCSDIRLGQTQAPNVFLGCPGQTIRAVTNILGETVFTVVGASNAFTCAPGVCPPGPGMGCVRVFADGVFMGNVTAVVYDLDGVSPGAEDGINALDPNWVRTEVACAGFGGPYHGRVDYNQDGVITAADLATYIQLVVQPAMTGLGSAQGSGGGGFCP